MNNFENALKHSDPVILDGGLATQLESMGFDIDGALWSAKLLASNPRAIVDAHRAYLDAGADCIISASYQASREGFALIGKTPEEADALIASSVALALNARQEFMTENTATDRAPIVAASVGPYGATQNDGSEYTGVYNIGVDELRAFHQQRLMLLDQTCADVLAVETIPNAVEAEVLAGLLNDVDTPAWISFSCRNGKELSDGTPLAEVTEQFAEHSRVYAVGVNCTAPEFISPLISILKNAAPKKKIVVYPNSGEFYHSHDNSWSGMACDFDNAFDVAAWQKAGVKFIGGCCRTGPNNIAAIRARL
ncbi:MAG: homocysteine S-methyltransferase [Woeseia sp.]|jgi:homocysteine S-methyltransferase|nr:homocysteine S-methyltransferase [Woeseia sp.]MBT6210489.1 homocysteine S-methyltransferase [Woeseia sp.]